MAAHPLLTPVAAASRLGLSVAELLDLIRAGKGPAYINIRRNIRFIARDIDEWAEALTRTCDDCKAEPDDKSHPSRSSHQK